MALTHGRLFHFTPDVLLSWGGGLAPRVFGQEWWRAGSHLFVHGDLAHLAGNLLFLLLIAPLVERLLGSVRFALVYLFAGLGGGLLGMGTYPQHVVVGASAAIYGLYGALLGCCLAGPRSAPWRLVAHRGALLLLFTGVSLLGEWLDVTKEPVAHLSGFAFGLLGGLLCGHQLQPSAARWKSLRVAVVATVFVGLISLTAWRVHRCAARALECYERYDGARDRERDLLGRFDDALHQWEEGRITGAEWKRELEQSLLPACQDARSSSGLKLTGELAELEQHSFTMQDFWKELRSLRVPSGPHDDGPLTIEEYGKMYRLLCKVRLDTWRALADDLPGNRVLVVRSLLDDHELRAMFAGLDDQMNEDNPLYRWFEMRRTGLRPVGREKAEPDLGLIKNRGFESGLEGWTTYTIGPPSRFEFDTDVARRGRQALRVTAPLPTDTGCYQDIRLTPGRWCRYSGWVRTRGLVPHGARCWGTLCVCRGGGNELLAQANSNQGDTEWTQMSVPFQAPAGGLTRIYVMVSGWGQASGTAWFDDLKLVAVSEASR
jgi:membrane associated rhomboid family serine protease